MNGSSASAATSIFARPASRCVAGSAAASGTLATRHLLSVISLVALGRGVALVPRTLGTAAVPGVVLKPLTGAPAHAQYSAIWHPENPSPVLARAVELLGAGG